MTLFDGRWSLNDFIRQIAFEFQPAANDQRTSPLQ
jgi:hypothetical protein